MDKDQLIQRLMATFVAELDDHVRALEGDLLALEKSPAPHARAELFSGLFRTAHSLKGSARSVGVGQVEMLGHHLEEIFAAARDGRLPVDPAFFGLVLPAIDALSDAVRRLRAGADLVDAPVEETVRQLARRVNPRPDGRAMPSAAPSATSVAASPKPWAATVRVPAEKLDALLTQIGELLTIRHRAELRGEEAVALHDAVSEWRKDWRRVEQGLTLLLRRDAELDKTSRHDEMAPRAALRRQIERALGRSKDGFAHVEQAVQHLATAVRADRGVIEQTAGALETEVLRARMLPFAEACEGLERMVRDLSARDEKQVALIVEGGDIELDRSVLEGLKDPLLHLVRNAVDHGIETTMRRREAGKPDVGRIEVAAALRGTRVEITVRDDGRGLDLAAIREQLRKQELPVPGDERDLAQTIFLPGFSTSARVTPLSGRGVGLDVVKTRLAALRGTTGVSFRPGHGTCFTLSVPLTLTSVRAVLVGAGGQVFAIDTASVHRMLRIGLQDIRVIEGRDVVLLAGVPVPVVSLTAALGLGDRAPLVNGGAMPVVVLTNGSRLIGFAVDTLEAERDIVVRVLGPRLRGIRQVVGATNLPDGSVVFILNAADLVARSAQLSSARALASTREAPRAARKRLLVVDDSATVRALQKSILEAAGYDIRVAVDGVDAWQTLSEHGADLVVSDVEMPHMNGFLLTEAIRGSKRFRELPVILVTAMENETDKARGLAAGADAYCVKSAFDQEALLAMIEQML